MFAYLINYYFYLTGSAKINKLLKARWNNGFERIKDSISCARIIFLYMDGWTKKGFQASYLGLSNCFCDNITNQVCHVMLNLIKLPHPHTGELLASKISERITYLNIPVTKVAIVITDNGSDMIKAINILQAEEKKKTEQSGEAGCSDREDNITQMDECSDAESEESYDTENEDDQTSMNVIDFELPDSVLYRRMPCLAHTLQLLIKPLCQNTKTRSYFGKTAAKALKIISSIRKSSVKMQELVMKTNRTVVSNVSTR